MSRRHDSYQINGQRSFEGLLIRYRFNKKIASTDQKDGQRLYRDEIRLIRYPCRAERCFQSQTKSAEDVTSILMKYRKNDIGLHAYDSTAKYVAKTRAFAQLSMQL